MIDARVRHRTRGRRLIRTILLAGTLAILLAGTRMANNGGITRAQTSPSFDLSWHVIANGGGVAGSASYRISGTVGQAAAGPPIATSAGFAVTGGYWTFTTQHRIYLPAVIRS